MRVGILGMLDNPYIADLQRAAREYHPGMETVSLRYSDLQVGLGRAEQPVAAAASSLASGGFVRDVFLQGSPSTPSPSSGSVTCDSPLFGSAPSGEAPSREVPSDQLRGLDALLVRSMPIGSLEQVIFRMDCLQTWQSRGLRIVNPPRSLEIAIDKWLCLQRLSEAEIAVPPTICCQTRSAAMEALQALGGDVLVKPLFGGEGRGILRVNDKDLAWRMFGTLQQLGQVLYLQQFIEHFGYDIRVLFIGEKQYAIRRVASDGGWRTNLSQGSRAEPHTLSGEQQQVAERSRQAVGGSLLGVDLLPARDGRLWVLEVNAIPGWKGVSAALNVDIARQILDFIATRP